MCSIITHPAIPLALSGFLPQENVSPDLLLAGAVCSIVPDLDVVGFRFGIRYGDMLGHRGFTHSLLFAVILAALLMFTLFRNRAGKTWVILLFLFLSTLSHPLLDMLTNGGLGVALFAPFSDERYFFPWRPIEVSPLTVGKFFSDWGARVIISELKWVWLPSAVVFTIGQVIRRYR
jgi:inner membrane protein